MIEQKLVDKEELMKKHPALKGRGRNSRYRLEWLIRTRQIPIVRIGGRIYFDEAEIAKWIEKRKIQVNRGQNDQ